MRERTQLDEIEDTEFAIAQLIHKGKPEAEVAVLLEKRGATAEQAEAILAAVLQTHSGFRRFERGAGTRATNFLIDAAVVGALLYFTMKPGNKDTLTEVALVVLLPLSYYFLLESTTGQTLGKMATGSIVVGENGKKPGPWRVLLRTVARLHVKAALSAFSDGRTFHDVVSATYVVDKSRWEKDYNTF